MTVKLTLPILESGYSVAEPASTFAVATKGGFSRRRADLDDASLIVTLSYQLTEETYTALMLFYKLNNGEPFLIDLIIDNAVPTESTAYFTGGPQGGPQLTQISGLNYWVSLTLEVESKVVDPDFDASVVAVWEASDGESEIYLEGFGAVLVALPPG